MDSLGCARIPWAHEQACEVAFPWTGQCRQDDAASHVEG